MTPSQDASARSAMTARGAWTEEAVETLKRLWADPDLSAALIAKRLGVTRNAVLGKIHRLGLSKPRGARPPPARVPTPQSARRARAERPARAAGPVSALARSSVGPASSPEPGPGLVPRLEDLPRRGCHWPLGDPRAEDFAFCGRAAERGPYCAAHAALAYRGPGVKVAALARWLRR